MIHCIGDSHSAVFSGEEKMQPCWPEISSNLIPGFKSYRIGPATAYQLHTKQNIIEPLIFSLNLGEEDKIMFCFGEVDIRAHLIKQMYLQKRAILDLVKECINRYLDAIDYYRKYTTKIIVCGPIASWNDDNPYSGPSYGTNLERNEVTKLFNQILETECARRTFDFVTIFYEMLNPDNSTNTFFLDDWEGSHIHLSQRAMPIILRIFKERGII
jgi:hypothetical protein